MLFCSGAWMVLVASCALVSSSGGSCDPFELTSSTTANFEVSGDEVKLVVRQEGEPEVDVWSSTSSPSSSALVSIAATEDQISAESPGVEAFVRREGSAFAEATVTLLGEDTGLLVCEAGGFVIDYSPVSSRTGLSIGGVDYPIPADVPSGGVYSQQVF